LPDFRLKCRERSQCRSFSCRTHDHHIPDAIEILTNVIREADANRVGSIIHDDGCCCRLALQNGTGIQLDFLCCKSRSRGHRRIDGHHHRRTTDRVFNTVFDVRYPFDLFDLVGDFGSPLLK
jgi:hypothetical protein